MTSAALPRTLAATALLVLGGLRPIELRAQDTPAEAPSDSLLLLELERELAQGEASSQVLQGAPASGARTTNPDISLIGDVRAWYASEPVESGEPHGHDNVAMVDEAGDGRTLDVAFHELEAAFRSAVDPYARADIYLSMGRHDGGDLEMELEEAYLTTLSLPFRLQARVGKFRSQFGKINRIHPHALPFIDMPAVYVNYLGDEGLNDEGISMSWLLPNRRFFQELTVEWTRGPDESPTFARSAKNRFLYTGHLKNFWDLSEESTFELGFSGAAGPNEVGGTALLGGIDLTYRWKPLRFNTYHSLTLQSEILVSRQEPAPGTTFDTFGGYALASWQLARRWHLIGRYDFADLPLDGDWNERAAAAFLGWYATEFQKWEIGLKVIEGSEMEREIQGLVRLVFVIGAHGAHEY